MPGHQRARIPFGRRLVALLVALAACTAGAVAVGAAPAVADPDLGAAVAAASAAAAGRGQVGIAVLDRETGRLYENAAAHTQMRSASVVKIFVAENLLDRQRRGQITLTARDRQLFESMVRSSDDAAMSALYVKYGLVQIVADVARKYGLSEIGPPPTPGYWGMFQITADNVVKLYQGILSGGLVPADRDYLLGLMRSATPNGVDGFYQYFGIPDALGSGETWGVKQGWMCCQEGQRRLHTTGILGAGARFAVAFTSQYSSGQSYAYGAQTLTAAVRTVFAQGVPKSGSTRNPVGQVDVATEVRPGVVRLTGWTYDPDAPGTPLTVQADLDGRPYVRATAAGARPDVARVHPGAGPNHGISVEVAVPAGRHQICATALNTGPGSANTALGCLQVTIVHDPVGALDVVTTAPGSATVAGWALDADAPAQPLHVHVYVDGALATATTTTGARPDVLRRYPAGGTPGYGATVPLAAGPHTVCTYAINATGTPGANPQLGCRTVTVPAAVQGALDTVTAGTGSVSVRGWAFSPVAPGRAVVVRVQADGTVLGTTTTGTARPDVARHVAGAGPNQGYEAPFTLAAGTHQVCVAGVATAAGTPDTPLGCGTVVVG